MAGDTANDRGDSSVGSDFGASGFGRANAVFVAGATQSASSGTSVVVAGNTVDDRGDSNVGSDFSASGFGRVNAVFVGDATQSASSGTGNTADERGDSSVGCDFGAFVGNATESVRSGTIGGVGSANSCLPGDANEVGGGGSVGCSVDGTIVRVTNGILEDFDFANDSGGIDGNISLGASNDIRGGGGANASASTSGKHGAKAVAVVKPLLQTCQVCLNVNVNFTMKVFSSIGLVNNYVRSANSEHIAFSLLKRQGLRKNDNPC